MDRKKLEEWITIQCRKGGPALDILYAWLEELSSRRMTDGSLRRIIYDEYSTAAGLALMEKLYGPGPGIFHIAWGSPSKSLAPEDPRPRIHEKGGYARLHQQHVNPRRKK